MTDFPRRDKFLGGDAPVKKYDDSQPRDENGRWTGDGGGAPRGNYGAHITYGGPNEAPHAYGAKLPIEPPTQHTMAHHNALSAKDLMAHIRNPGTPSEIAAHLRTTLGGHGFVRGLDRVTSGGKRIPDMEAGATHSRLHGEAMRQNGVKL